MLTRRHSTGIQLTWLVTNVNANTVTAETMDAPPSTNPNTTTARRQTTQQEHVDLNTPLSFNNVELKVKKRSTRFTARMKAEKDVPWLPFL